MFKMNLTSKPELTIFIPVYDEEKNIDALFSALLKVLDEVGRSSEVIVVDDGSNDDSFERIDAQNIESRPLPWVVPQPGAYLVHKKISSLDSNISHYQMMKDICWSFFSFVAICYNFFSCTELLQLL